MLLGDSFRHGMWAVIRPVVEFLFQILVLVDNRLMMATFRAETSRQVLNDCKVTC